MSGARKVHEQARGTGASEAGASLVVMKFGGTSVEDAKAILRTAAIVRGRRERGLSPIVVVSAMARVTDQLLAAGAAAGRADRVGALAIAARLRNRHLETAADLLRSELLAEIRSRHLCRVRCAGRPAAGNCRRGRADATHQRPCGRLRREGLLPDGCGSICPAWALWRSRGRPRLHRNGRPLRQAVPHEAAIEERLNARVMPLVHTGNTPVMGGFIGATVDGVDTTLGRGGSDFTAALVGGGCAPAQSRSGPTSMAS